MIEFRGVTKQYPDGTVAVGGVDLVVPPRTTTVLVGTSGSGKTTLLRMINRMVDPSSGAVLIDGTDVATVDPVRLRRSIGYVMQNSGLLPHRTVLDNVMTVPLLTGTRRQTARARAMELLETVGLDASLAQKYPAQLSGGQQQRVALARALVNRPRVLLLDEPLAALDAKLKESLRDELAELLRRLHITAVHVTHDQQEALAIADRLAVMRGGRIVQVGRGEDLYRTPAHPFVAEFLGRVNRLDRNDAARQQGVIMLGGVALPCPDGLAAQPALLVRPEDIELGPPQTGWGQARVVQRTFLGERVQLRLDTGDQPPLLAEAGRDCPWQQDQQVGIRTTADRLMPATEIA